jgi:hypothetical protein
MKLKKLIQESVWGKRAFGEKLPTIADYQKSMNEAKIDSKKWKKMKYQIEDQIDDLVKLGEDYAIFQSAKHTSKTLKKIQKLWRSL